MQLKYFTDNKFTQSSQCSCWLQDFFHQTTQMCQLFNIPHHHINSLFINVYFMIKRSKMKTSAIITFSWNRPGYNIQPTVRWHRWQKKQLTCMTLGKMVLLKWSSRVGALKSLLYTSSSSFCNRNHVYRHPLSNLQLMIYCLTWS